MEVTDYSSLEDFDKNIWVVLASTTLWERSVQSLVFRTGDAGTVFCIVAERIDYNYILVVGVVVLSVFS